MRKILLATVLALAAGGAVAVASIPGGDGVITACYSTAQTSTFGTLRVIDPSMQNDPGRPVPATYSCQTGESQITWNQQGPSGPVGPVGPPGERGDAGAAATPSLLTFEAKGSRIYLDIGDIKGESHDKGHKGEIEVLEASIGDSSGQAAGKRKQTPGQMVITKKFDKASPTLFKAAATGKHFGDAVLTLAKKKKGKGKQADFLVIKLEDAFISRVGTTDPPQGSPSESVTLNFTKLRETYKGNGTSHISLVPSQLAAP